MATALKEIYQSGGDLPAENIFTALHHVYTRVEYVRKSGRNDAQKYNYAGEADLINVVRPAMVEAGIVFFCSDIRDQETREIRKVKNGFESLTINYAANFTFTFAHARSGTSIAVVARGEGSDSLDKSAYKAMTGALKYALRQTFVIETGNDPDDHRNYRKIDFDQDDEPAPARSNVTPLRSEAKAPAPQAEDPLLVEAKAKLAAIPTMDEAGLRAIKPWFSSKEEGEQATRWAVLGQIDGGRELRQAIVNALGIRAGQLGVNLSQEPAKPAPKAEETAQEPAPAANEDGEEDLERRAEKILGMLDRNAPTEAELRRLHAWVKGPVRPGSTFTVEARLAKLAPDLKATLLRRLDSEAEELGITLGEQPAHRQKGRSPGRAGLADLLDHDGYVLGRFPDFEEWLEEYRALFKSDHINAPMVAHHNIAVLEHYGQTQEWADHLELELRIARPHHETVKSMEVGR